MANPVATVASVAGEVIPASTRMMLAGIGILFLMWIVGIASLCAWWMEIDIPWPPWSDSTRRMDTVSAVVTSAWCVLCWPMALRFWLTRERLLVGADRLQIVYRGKV